MGKNRNWLFAIIVPCVAFGICLILAEAVLRFAPVFRGLQVQNVTAEQPLFRFQSDREFVWSRTWRFRNPTRGKTNNAGFVNNQDYDPNGSSPLLAVVGDSYIEALMVPHNQTLQGRLQARVGGSGRVYSFAGSGAPLSQYLAWVRHARDTYKPDGLVIVVVGNDFDQSLASVKQGPGFHHFFETESGDLELRLVPFRRGLVSQIGAPSMLFWYAVNHLEAEVAVQRLKANVSRLIVGGSAKQENETPKYLGNTETDANAERVRQSKRAVDKFLELLPDESGLPPNRIAIVMDPIRRAIYEPDLVPAKNLVYFGQMRRYLGERGAALGITVVDLEAPMADAYKRTGERFEWPFDGHWNGRAHAIAAEAVAETRLFESLFGGGS